ncbi:MAG: FTR1 family protein [Oscillatoriaceae bacterium SKW80]|nr:FTR1 family protein [Oscillatoriaceae bacterium SKYG93]MCX8121493.1 FTR1 family protein [Oscillatoriaceae bacterium SKW80]MDW8452921.1 FTR1 family protein [Oscillatoriaceae cyanobacterium SKYGB_i_bin93]HIK27838.1 FTR1 family protein [Oscillatoriaceae cyanobacterium M7585_C2015_266]
MDFSAAIPTFVIALREGVEAALVVGIVLACLKKAEKSQLNSWAYSGVVSGILASVIVGIVLNSAIQGVARSERPYALVLKPLLEAGFCVVAIAMLSWMLIWMTSQAKSLKSEIEGSLNTALNQDSTAAGWAVFTLIFIAVLREGFETVLFIAANAQSAFMSVIGATGGLLLAAAIGAAIFQWGVKINLRLFFQIMGVFLLLIVSGLVISALKNFDAAAYTLAQLNPQFASLCFSSGSSCLLGARVWDATAILPDNQFPGIILKSLFGYRAKLYFAQAVAYILFLVTVGGFYFQSLASLAGNAGSHQPSAQPKG